MKKDKLLEMGDDEDEGQTPIEGLFTSTDAPIECPFLDWFTLEDVAKQLGVHLSTVRGWVMKGKLPATNMGRGVRVPSIYVKPEDLEKFKATYKPRQRRSSSIEPGPLL